MKNFTVKTAILLIASMFSLPCIAEGLRGVLASEAATNVLVVKGRINDNGMAIADATIIKGLLPNNLVEHHGLKVTLYDASGQVLHQQSFSDPRRAVESGSDGKMRMLPVADFAWVLPYISGVVKVVVTPEQTGSMFGEAAQTAKLGAPVPAEAPYMLTTALKSFCDKHNGDPLCVTR